MKDNIACCDVNREARGAGKRFFVLMIRMLAAVLALVTLDGIAPRADAEAMEGSRLIGLLMTTRDIAPLVGDDGVLWADIHEGTVASEAEYRFEDVPGLRFICDVGQDEDSGIISTVDDGISRADFNLEDERLLQMDGTILFVPGQEAVSFFYNPVLKAGDGRVFALPGDPMTVDASMNPPGAAVGQTLRDERKHREGADEITDVVEVSMEIRTVREPLQITLLQFNDDHELLKTEAYVPGTVPGEIVPLAEADYLILETRESDVDGGCFNRREIFGREEDGMNTLSCRGDGICIQHYHEILWPNDR